MRRLRYINLILALSICLIPSLLRAQEDGYSDYMAKVERQSLLYRGKIEKRYNFKYTGTYFAFQDQYVSGSIMYNKKLYRDVLLNLNSFTDEVSVRLSESHLPIVLDKTLIEWFKLGDNHFVRVSGDKVLADGFYQVLVDDGDRLYKKIYQAYREELSGSGQQTYVERLFTPEITYYVSKEGEPFVKVSGKGTFVKLYKEDKKEINRYFREASKTEIRNKDLSYTKVMEVVR